MSSVPYIAKPILNARDAIASHVRWKITLLTAARMQEALSDRATLSIQHPEQCAIRRWLLSDHTAPLRDRPEYTVALNRHIDFHREMQRIAHLLNNARYVEAESLLASGSAFEQTSLAVANALMSLDRAQRQQPASPKRPVGNATLSAAVPFK
jgi:methyl-accepting chemotaxis protein